MDKILLVEDEDIIRRGLLYAVDWLKEECVVVGEAMDGVDGRKKSTHSVRILLSLM